MPMRSQSRLEESNTRQYCTKLFTIACEHWFVDDTFAPPSTNELASPVDPVPSTKTVPSRLSVPGPAVLVSVTVITVFPVTFPTTMQSANDAETEQPVPPRVVLRCASIPAPRKASTFIWLLPEALNAAEPASR